MADHQPFLQAILANPNDDAPRLIYADWLEEQGDTARAEFIRVQCELATMPKEHPDRKLLVQRELELRKRKHNPWMRQARKNLTGGEFARGFLEKVTMTSNQLLLHAEAIFQQHPVRTLRLTEIEGNLEQVLSLDLSERLPTLTTLDLIGQGLRDNVINRLLTSSLIFQLQELLLRKTLTTDYGVRALLNTLASASPKMCRFDLRDTFLSSEVEAALKEKFGDRVLVGLYQYTPEVHQLFAGIVQRAALRRRSNTE